MEGTPVDLTVNADSNVLHDHTYYGRGCKNNWGTSGEGGSQTPCADSDAGGRYVTTADGETQKNGTYYTFQASTSGSGAGLSTNNANSSDTFCPLGWQLPYSGTGGDYYNTSRSWKHLFDYYSLTDDQAGATKIKSYPFSYVYSGLYFWGTGRLYNQDSYGPYWSSTVVSSTESYYLYVLSSGIRPIYTYSKARGQAIRCV